MRRRKRRQKTPEQMRRRASRRQRFFHAVGRVVFLLVLLAAATLALTVFFKVDTITVEGAMKYRAEEIVAGMDVKQGDNLYLWNKVKVSDALLERFPYLETVQIRRHLPNALVVTVTECTAAVAVPSDGGYLYLSEQGKVLEQSAQNNGLPVVVGMTLSGALPGQMLSADASDEVGALLTILQTMDAAEMLDGLSFINLSDLHDIRIGYQDRFDIQIGTINDLAYHLRFAQTVIEERLSPSDIGRLYWDDQNRLHYVPDTAENVAKSGMDAAAAAAAGSASGDAAQQTDGTEAQDTETQDSDGTDAQSVDSSGEISEDGSGAQDQTGEGEDQTDTEEADWDTTEE